MRYEYMILELSIGAFDSLTMRLNIQQEDHSEWELFQVVYVSPGFYQTIWRKPKA